MCIQLAVAEGSAQLLRGGETLNVCEVDQGEITTSLPLTQDFKPGAANCPVDEASAKVNVPNKLVHAVRGPGVTESAVKTISVAGHCVFSFPGRFPLLLTGGLVSLAQLYAAQVVLRGCRRRLRDRADC